MRSTARCSGHRGSTIATACSPTTYMMNVAARLLPALVFKTPWYRRARRRNDAAIREVVRAVQRVRGQAMDHRPSPPRWRTVRNPGESALHRRRGRELRGLRPGGQHRLRRPAGVLHALRNPARRRAAGAAGHRSTRAAFAAGLDDATAVRRLRLLRSVYDETLRVHPFAVGMAFDVASDFEFLGHRVGPRRLPGADAGALEHQYRGRSPTRSASNRRAAVNRETNIGAARRVTALRSSAIAPVRRWVSWN